MVEAEWSKFLDGVRRCSKCKSDPRVRVVRGAKPWNGCDPPNPSFAKHMRCLFISEAPPGGSGTFFWCHPEDRLRMFLFNALRQAGLSIRNGDEGLADFKALGFYLLPSFPYPCGQKVKGNIRNAKPSREMIQHAATKHLSAAIDIIDPTDVILLGESAGVAGATLGAALGLKVIVSYWPTERTGHFGDVVSTFRKTICAPAKDQFDVS